MKSRRTVVCRSADAVEVWGILWIQSVTAAPAAVHGALLLSRAGEHALGPIACGLAGATLDPERRRAWVRATMGVASAQMLSVVVKRLVRRPRPGDPRISVRLRAPGPWGFPSSHAASTAAAAVAYSPLLGRRLPLLLVPLMAASRLVVGLHYPSDVLAGAVLGGAVGLLAGARTPVSS